MTIDRQLLADELGYADPETMCRDLYAKHKSSRKIEELLGISNKTFLNWLREYHIPRLPKGGKHFYQNPNSVRTFIRENADKFKDLTTNQIQKKYKINPGYFREVAWRYNIPYQKYKRD